MDRVITVADLRARVSAARADGSRIGLVPTMGALHAGHLSLVTHARTVSDVVVVSIFVNPTQFGPGEDLDAYPRDLDGDEAALAGVGEQAPDLVFAPTVAEMYPGGVPPLTTVRVTGLTDRLCGTSRPGHFDGVATVVSKLHNAVQPDVAVYGRKDFQQLRVIQRMVADLNQPVEVLGAPTVREPDGVAMSSRNRYLEPTDRRAATALSQGLRQAVVAAREARAAGRPMDAGMLREAVTVILDAQQQIRIDYVDVLDADTLQPPATRPVDPTPPDAPDAIVESPDAIVENAESPRGYGAGPGDDADHGEPRWLVAVAAHIGAARLIDNVVIGEQPDEDRLLAATAQLTT